MAGNGEAGQPGGDEKRVRCLYCGANNFPVSLTCWQCGRKLVPARESSREPLAVDGPLTPDNGGTRGAQGMASHAPTPAPLLSGTNLSPGVNPALAGKAAAALGLMFPFFGLPVGIVFLMLDDERKVKIGWATIVWSLIGTVLSAVTLLAPLAAMWSALKALAPHGAPGGGLPTLPGTGPDGLQMLWPFVLLL